MVKRFQTKGNYQPVLPLYNNLSFHFEARSSLDPEKHICLTAMMILKSLSFPGT